MDIEYNIFKKYDADFDKLSSYGFKKIKTKFTYEKEFMDGSFRAVIEISKDGKITGNVYDVENDDIYLPLRVENQQGAFAGIVRAEYEKILENIREKCFTEKVFITSQANRLSEWVFKTYNDKPVFMWDEYPTFGVFKNPESNKWYGLIMNIKYSLLDKTKNGEVEVMNLKLEPDEIQELVKIDGFYPAYHMNKKYWITLTLNDTIADGKIQELIDKSHNYTIKKRKTTKDNRS